MSQAVELLRKAGQQDELPRALLARATMLARWGRFEEAAVDLRAVLEMTRRGRMKLFEIDAKLQWVSLTIARFKASQISGESYILEARQMLEGTREAIDELSYLRRRPEARALRAKLNQL
ncbi:MAG: hypothetical protein WA746_29810 [Isosphaeraceae bacterium]|nr:hypothetical protein [Isosphaeraceae bacterium]